MPDLEVIAKHLGDGGEEDRADQRADPGGQAADHGDEDHLHRERNGEHRIRVDVAVIEA